MQDPLIGMTLDISIVPEKQENQTRRGGPGSQVLPVAELADSFQGEPEDGMEYLFLVRREAVTHPDISRVANPYAIEETVQDVYTPVSLPSRPSEPWRIVFMEKFKALRTRMTTAPPLSSFPPPTHKPFPLAQDESGWKTFIEGRQIPLAKGLSGDDMSVMSGSVLALDVEDDMAYEDLGAPLSLEAAKAAALASLELDAPPPPLTIVPAIHPLASPTHMWDPKHPQHTPNTTTLLHIPPPAIIRILGHFADWLQERADLYDEALHFVPSTIFAPTAVRRRIPTAAKPSITAVEYKPPAQLPSKPTTVHAPALPRPPLPTSHEAHWILSLLSRLDSLLAGYDISTLRILAKLLISLAETSYEAQVKRQTTAEEAGTRRTLEERARDEEDAEGRAYCWMAVTAIAFGWSQIDLWNDVY